MEADEGQFPDTIAVIDGDPLAGPVNYTGERIALDDARLLAPVIPRSKILAVGKNYAAHAAEFDGEVPPEPLIFMKPNTSVIGPDDVIVRPQLSHNVHFEGELAVVIGRFCRKVPVERAAEVIFGYTVANDVTARDLQRSDGQWTRAKDFDTFCPLGPWIVTHLGIDEAADLSLVTSVDGVNVISGETASPTQSGYVLEPYGSVEIAGWRKSMTRTAAFYFTDLGDSYAARTGRPGNVGVIGVAVFQEKVAPPVSAAASGEVAPPRRSEAPAAGAARAPSSESERATAKLGTGHGRGEASPVTLTNFERATAAPAETLTLRYDRRENLVAMGVLPPPWPPVARRDPDPFPGQLRFAPDPR